MEKEILRWLEAKKPWPISRQTVLVLEYLFGIKYQKYDLRVNLNTKILVSGG